MLLVSTQEPEDMTEEVAGCQSPAIVWDEMVGYIDGYHYPWLSVTHLQ